MRNLEVLCLPTQVNRKPNVGEITSSLKQKRGVIKMGGIMLARVVPSTAVHSVQRLNAFAAQKGKGLGAWPLPSTPIKRGCSSEPANYRNEHKRARNSQHNHVVGCSHSTFTFPMLRAVCLSLPDLQPLRKTPVAGFSRASRAVFSTCFSNAVFPMALHLYSHCYGRFLLGNHCHWCENHYFSSPFYLLLVLWL